MSTDNSEEVKEEVEDYWVDLRPTAAIAQIFTFVALVIYLYALVPQCICIHFRFSFFRQIAYILQMIRLFMLMAALLPCVLHSQVRSAFPDISGREFALAVLAALIGNIIVSVGMRKFFECNAQTLKCLLQYLPFIGGDNPGSSQCKCTCGGCVCSPPPPPCYNSGANYGVKPRPQCPPRRNACTPCSLRPKPAKPKPFCPKPCKEDEGDMPSCPPRKLRSRKSKPRCSWTQCD